MGFTTGFLGGVTLTYSVLYLSLYVHRANRNVQRTLLSQQANLLNSVVNPPIALPDPPAYEVRKAGLTEQLKDRWNREVEKVVRNVQNTDWTKKRELYEERAATVWKKVTSSEPVKELEQKVKEKVAGGETAIVTAAEDAKAKATTVREPRLLELK